MTTENTAMTKPIEYEANGKNVKLSGNMVKEYLVSGNAEVTNQEVVNFLQLCKFQGLNPFLNEAYLVKFRGRPAQIITSKEAFMKRANADPHFQGFKAGIIVQRGDEIVKLNGAIKLPKDTLIGGWAEVYRDDRKVPISVEISLDEFSKGQATWKQMPLNMIRKTAIVNALREAFPENLGSLYTEEEQGDPEANLKPRTVNAEEEIATSVDDLISDNSKEQEPKDVTSNKNSDEFPETPFDKNSGNVDEEKAKTEQTSTPSKKEAKPKKDVTNNDGSSKELNEQQQEQLFGQIDDLRPDEK
ncbi:phage recombination protein Bet [Fructilactobacillus fructivorans]|uniref:phage recombination protein Bet n=1 Tax=Fructilactobacillus fructivorans TaxID=1614 RepID=UPI000714BF50|nr:phage recombination protein Bet [Fructilactobacillus fructivorans]KRN13433.1 phage recombination protein Bet [Fructilactobacillus fructivorans]